MTWCKIMQNFKQKNILIKSPFTTDYTDLVNVERVTAISYFINKNI